jgi:hypothetical protein
MKPENADAVGAGVFLVGLGMIFLFKWFFPGILLVIGVASLANQAVRGRWINGLGSLLFFGGLTLVITLGIEWPIIIGVGLIGAGLLGLLRGFIRS